MSIFSSFIGNEIVTRNLESNVKNGQISHAYLFKGVRDIGKAELVKLFAQVLQCPDQGCQKCQICQLIAKGNHLDTMFFSDNGDSIHIKEIRGLGDLITRYPQSNYRVIIMENIERMPIPTQNAFLKILEEPPQKTVFLLTVSNIATILDTIISRCRVLAMIPVEPLIISNYLQNSYDIDNESLEQIVLIAQGKIFLAKKLAENQNLFAESTEFLRKIEQLISDDNLCPKFTLAEELSKDILKISNFLNILEAYLRNNLYYESLNAMSHSKIISLLEKTARSQDLINKNVNKKLVLENLLIDLCTR